MPLGLDQILPPKVPLQSWLSFLPRGPNPLVFLKTWGAPSFPGTSSSRGRAQPVRENNCPLAGQGEAWDLVDLNIPLHRLGNEAKVTQMVSQSKGMTPARGPGSACDSGHTRHRERKALALGWTAGPASGRFLCCRSHGDSPGSRPVSTQGFTAGEGRTSAQQLSVSTIQWKKTRWVKIHFAST